MRKYEDQLMRRGSGSLNMRVRAQHSNNEYLNTNLGRHKPKRIHIQFRSSWVWIIYRPNYKELYFKRTPNTSVFINGGRANPQRLLNNEEEEEAVATDRGNGNPIGAPNLGRSSRRLHNRRRFPVSLQVARTVKEGTTQNSTPTA